MCLSPIRLTQCTQLTHHPPHHTHCTASSNRPPSVLLGHCQASPCTGAWGRGACEGEGHVRGGPFQAKLPSTTTPTPSPLYTYHTHTHIHTHTHTHTMHHTPCMPSFCRRQPRICTGTAFCIPPSLHRLLCTTLFFVYAHMSSPYTPFLVPEKRRSLTRS